jgi:hypothetical protein
VEELRQPVTEEELSRYLAELEARTTPEDWAAFERLAERIERGEYEPVGQWVNVADPDPN